MAYDPTTGDTVMFGGQDGSNLLAETWSWDGSTWTQQAPATSPSTRSGPLMVYDLAAANMVLFGVSPAPTPFSMTPGLLDTQPCRPN